MESSRESIMDPDASEALLDAQTAIPYISDADIRHKLEVFFGDAYHQDSLGDTSVAITGFPAEYFDRYKDEDYDPDSSEPPIPGKRKITYFKRSKILVVTMPGRTHEIVAHMIEGRIQIKLNSMDQFEALESQGATTTYFPDITKEPDISFGPIRSGYFTFVAEIAVSQSQRDLDRIAKRWIESETSRVTQVLTLKFSTSIPRVYIKLWKRVQQENVGTGAEQRPRAGLDQEIEVTLDGDRPVATGVLQLSFELLFERRAQRGTLEQDLVFSGRELGSIAGRGWEVLGILPRNG
jgi:hypothetical protein